MRISPLHMQGRLKYVSSDFHRGDNANCPQACQSQVTQLLDCVRISKLFELLGATSDAVNPSSPVTMEVASGDKGLSQIPEQ